MKGGVKGWIVVRGVVYVLFDRIKGARSRMARATYWGVVGVLSVRRVRRCGAWRQAEEWVIWSGSGVVLIVHYMDGRFACSERQSCGLTISASGRGSARGQNGGTGVLSQGASSRAPVLMRGWIPYSQGRPHVLLTVLLFSKVGRLAQAGSWM